MGEDLNFSDIHMDVIFVANTKNQRLRVMTQNAIDTCRRADSLSYHFYVIEQNRTAFPYVGARTIYYDFPFNYNRCMNLGIFCSKSPFIALCNTDLVFALEWGVRITGAMTKGYLSACPSKRFLIGITEGYKVGKQIYGWCIVVHRSIFDKIGKLNEGVKFWFSDDIYMEQIKKAGIKHILVGNSNVKHLVSQTSKAIRSKETQEYRQGQRGAYAKARKDLLK